MIIGLCGMKGSGKDTVAAYLVKEHGFERRAFADSLKKSVAALFNIPYHEIDKYKNDPYLCVKIVHRDVTFGGEVSMSFRNFLQRYGTESHRHVFGENFWVDYCLPLDGFYTGRKIVITDVRFINEARRVRMFNGAIAEISNPRVPLDKDHHSSEVIDFQTDYVLFNDSTIEDLNVRIETMLENLASPDQRVRRVLG